MRELHILKAFNITLPFLAGKIKPREGSKPPQPLTFGKQSPRREVPKEIPRPWYVAEGKQSIVHGSGNIMVHTEKSLSRMRRACRRAANILADVEALIQPGVTTDEIDRFVHTAAIQAGSYPSPLNYGKFPKSVCTSVNECAAHGIPDDRPLREGDIVKVDVTVFYKGYHGDTCRTFAVGQVSEACSDLIYHSREATLRGIQACGPGRKLTVVGEAVEGYCDEHNYRVCGDLMGHGVGAEFHCDPAVFFVRQHMQMDRQATMRVNQTFTIEPAINMGTGKVRLLPDQWTLMTDDGRYSAQHEHTVLITETGYEILTLPDRNKAS